MDIVHAHRIRPHRMGNPRRVSPSLDKLAITPLLRQNHLQNSPPLRNFIRLTAGTPERILPTDHPRKHLNKHLRPSPDIPRIVPRKLHREIRISPRKPLHPDNIHRRHRSIHPPDLHRKTTSKNKTTANPQNHAKIAFSRIKIVRYYTTIRQIKKPDRNINSGFKVLQARLHHH